MNYNEMISIILQAVLAIFTIVILPYIRSIMMKYIGKQSVIVENETLTYYIMVVTDAIIKAASYTAQRYVDELKKSGKFGKDEWEEAFARTKKYAMEMITKDAMAIIEQAYGDFDKWLDATIETIVRKGE